MSRLPVSIEHDIHGGITVYAEERDSVLHSVMDVAAQVSPVTLANIARTLQEYHESAGTSAAQALDAALSDVPDRIALTVLKLTPEEALALGTALHVAAIELLGGAQ